MCVVGKYFVVFYVFSFPRGVHVGTLNLIASIPDPSILTLFYIITSVPKWDEVQALLLNFQT